MTVDTSGITLTESGKKIRQCKGRGAHVENARERRLSSLLSGRISRPRMGGAVPSIRQPVRGLSQHSLFAFEQLSTFVIAKPNMLSLRRRNLQTNVLLERDRKSTRLNTSH